MSRKDTFSHTTGAAANEVAGRDGDAFNPQELTLLSRAVEALDEGVVIFDNQDRLVYFNDRYREMYAPASTNWQLGQPLRVVARETAIGCLGITDPDQIESFVERRIINLRASREPFEQVLVNGRRLRVYETEMGGGWIVGTRVDVTQLSLKERELAESKQRFQDYAESGSDWMWEMDADLRYSAFSGDLERKMGARPEDLIGKKRTDFCAPDIDAAAWQAHLSDLENRRQFRDFVYPFMTSEHSVGWVRINGKPRLDAMGNFIGYRGTGADVTQEINALHAKDAAEAALREQHEILAAQHEELNAAHADLERMAAELRLARDDAQSAYSAKSEFLATISHEIRTPMNGVLGTIQLLAASELAEHQKELIYIARESATGLLSLLNDILDASKLETGQMQVEFISFSVDEVVRDVARTFKATAEAKGLELMVSLDPAGCDRCRGDPTKLRQILTNLVSNAIKFTPSGKVEVSAKPIGGTNALMFEVRDSGVGIQPDRCDDLFSPFTQAESSTSRHYGGTGLGLAICKKLVQLMDGEIGVDSAPEQGSRFWFTLNLATAVRRDGPMPLKPAEAVHGNQDGLRILLAEDNATNQYLLVRMIESIGHEVVVANNGAEAVTRVQDETFDIVLMDIQMPDVDGPTAARQIRGLKSDVATIPILAVTAGSIEGEHRRYVDMGFDDCVAKPISASELVDTLDLAKSLIQSHRTYRLRTA